MKNVSIRKLVIYGLMIALVFLATYSTRIPTPLPGGYFNLGDAVIMLAAVFFGPVGGLVAGGIGSCLADIAAASLIFAPITLVVKGIEGLVVGLLALKYIRSKPEKNPRLILALAVGAVIMVAGYFSAEAFVLSLFDKTFGVAAAAGEIVANLIQGGLSALVAYILILILSKTMAKSSILNRWQQ